MITFFCSFKNSNTIGAAECFCIDSCGSGGMILWCQGACNINHNNNKCLFLIYKINNGTVFTMKSTSIRSSQMSDLFVWIRAAAPETTLAFSRETSPFTGQSVFLAAFLPWRPFLNKHPGEAARCWVRSPCWTFVLRKFEKSLDVRFALAVLDPGVFYITAWIRYLSLCVCVWALSTYFL